MTTPEPAEMKPCREAFERWWSPLYDRSLERNGDGYSLMQTQLAWDAWKNSWNTRTPPAAVAEDAVEAMNTAIAESLLVEYSSYPSPVEVIRHLSAQGYTLRRETMTEAELEEKVWNMLTLGGFTMKQRFAFLVKLAKKFRG